MAAYGSDKWLVRRMLAHDEQAFRHFFDQYFQRLYRFSLTRVGHDKEVAKDVTQASLIRAMQKLSTYRGEAALYTWICTICRREISDHYRKTARINEKQVLIEDSEEAKAALESLQAVSSDPESLLTRNQRLRIIQVALDQLPSHYGDALEWKYIYGDSTADIARKLSLGTEAAQSLLARARRAFHDAYRTLIQSSDDQTDKNWRAIRS